MAQQMQLLPPSSIEAEEAVLGSILIDSSIFEIVMAKIGPGDFYMAGNGMIFRVMMQLYHEGRPVDFLTVAEELNVQGNLGAIGGQAFLSHLVSVVPTSIHAPGYADIVLEKSTKRRLLALCSNIASDSYNGHNPEKIIDMAQMALASIANRILPHTAPEQKDVSVVPPLPEYAAVDDRPDSGVGNFLTAYFDYAGRISPMTPKLFHISAALWLICVLIARRLKLIMHFDTIYPNLYFLWLASSTLFHKTTALNVARKMAWKAFPFLMAAQDTTLEALISSMAGEEPPNMPLMTESTRRLWIEGRNFSAQRGLVLDELSGLMAGAGKDYNAGLIEAFLRFYDSDDFPFVRQTRGQGMITIKAPYLSILGATTPAAVYRHMSGEVLWSNGWWPRFAMITPDDDHPDYRESEETDPPNDLIDALANLHARLSSPKYPNPPEARCVVMQDDAMEAWRKYNKAVSYDLVNSGLSQRLWPVYGRIPVQALKVATCLAAIDWTNEDYAPMISYAHMARSITITEEWRASAHRAMYAVTESAEVKFVEQVLGYLERYGSSGASLRDLYRPLHKTPDEVEGAIRQLIMTGEVIEMDNVHTSRGQWAKKYRVVAK